MLVGTMQDADLEGAAADLVAALRSAAQRCACSLPRGPPWRDAAWSRATDGYWDAANLLEDLVAEHLQPALAAEREATQELTD